MNNLTVTVDVNGLLAALRKLNPSADLTGVKAYLLDMALAESDAPSSTAYEAPPLAEVPQRSALPELPEGVIGALTERPKTRVMVNRALKPTGDAKTEKERKRKELEDFTSMDSKTLLERLVPTGRRNEHNQVTDEGMDSADGGELTIG